MNALIWGSEPVTDSNFPQCKESRVHKRRICCLEGHSSCTSVTFRTSCRVKKLLCAQEFSSRTLRLFYLPVPHTDLPSMMVMTSFILIWSLSSSSKSCRALISVGIICRTHTHMISGFAQVRWIIAVVRIETNRRETLMWFCIMVIYLVPPAFPLLFLICPEHLEHGHI